MTQTPAVPCADDESAPRVAHCAKCGVTSTLPELFQRGRISQKLTGMICPRCVDNAHGFNFECLVTAMVLVLLGGVVLGGSGWPDAAQILTVIPCAVLFVPVLTVLHEGAHALAAILLMLRVYEIRIGWYGKPLVRFYVGCCKIQITRTPVGGWSLVAHPTSR